MKAMMETQELVRRFNEDEAVWRAFEHKRALRRLPGVSMPFSEQVLDYLDWQEAERECRMTHAFGFFIDEFGKRTLSGELYCLFHTGHIHAVEESSSRSPAFYACRGKDFLLRFHHERE